MWQSEIEVFVLPSDSARLTARRRYAELEVVTAVGVCGANGNLKPTEVVVPFTRVMRGGSGPAIVVVRFERAYKNANND